MHRARGLGAKLRCQAAAPSLRKASTVSKELLEAASIPRERNRNFSIIAHVDHGKSTLCDRLLQTCGVLPPNAPDQFLDGLEVERARGITAAGSFMMDTLNFGWTYSYYIRTIILYLYYGKCRKIKDIIIFRGTADPFFSYDTSQLYSHQMIPVGLISKSHLAIPP